MKGIIKTASRFDSIWTMLLTLPALVMLLNTGIALHQGKATTDDFTSATAAVAGTFAGQYAPYVETTGALIMNGIGKAFKMATGCAGSAGGPIYLNPAMTGSNGCALHAMIPSPGTRSYY